MHVEAVRGDVTLQRVDAIVNAADPSLLGGGGVDGAIHAAAGPILLAECRELRRTRLPGGLPVGDAVATGAGELLARWVVHTVGPNRHAGETDPALLASCFMRSLDIAAGLGARSVAFPAVSAGVYGWDVHDVARVAVAAVRGWAAGLGEVVAQGGAAGRGGAASRDEAADRGGTASRVEAADRGGAASRDEAADRGGTASRVEAAAQGDRADLVAQRPGRVDLVRFVLFSDAALAAFSAALEEAD